MVATGASTNKASSTASAFATVRDVAGLRGRVIDWRGDGKTVALVPTMGAIHQGHISLVQAAQKQCDHVVVSLFVNPKQFGPTEDVGSYPVDETNDCRLLSEAGVDLLYAPAAGIMYPDGFATAVSVNDITAPLCGEFRPGHFAGVATVVAKLLLQGGPDLAVFGEKDYQQLLVIRRLVKDLDIPVEIIGAPTIREADGLAVSSRNAYLSEEERAAAPALYKALTFVADQIAGRTGSIDEACRTATASLEDAGFQEVDYVSVRDADTLGPVTSGQSRSRVFGAAWLGKARLIDNIAVVE